MGFVTAGADRVVRAQEGSGKSGPSLAGFETLQEGFMEVKG